MTEIRRRWVTYLRRHKSQDQSQAVSINDFPGPGPIAFATKSLQNKEVKKK